MPKYVCIRKCYRMGITYQIGDLFTTNPDDEILVHFKEVIGQEEEPKKELVLEDLSKKELIKLAEMMTIDLKELELDEKSRKSELISAIKAKKRDAKLNLPDIVS